MEGGGKRRRTGDGAEVVAEDDGADGADGAACGVDQHRQPHHVRRSHGPSAVRECEGVRVGGVGLFGKSKAPVRVCVWEGDVGLFAKLKTPVRVGVREGVGVYVCLQNPKALVRVCVGGGGCRGKCVWKIRQRGGDNLIRNPCTVPPTSPLVLLLSSAFYLSFLSLLLV